MTGLVTNVHEFTVRECTIAQRADANLGTENVQKTGTKLQATRLRILGTVLESRNTRVFQYDLPARN